MKQDVVKAFTRHELHVLCLAELGELDKGIGVGLQTTVRQWVSELLADSAAQPGPSTKRQRATDGHASAAQPGSAAASSSSAASSDVCSAA